MKWLREPEDQNNELLLPMCLKTVYAAPNVNKSMKNDIHSISERQMNERQIILQSKGKTLVFFQNKPVSLLEK